MDPKTARAWLERARAAAERGEAGEAEGWLRRLLRKAICSRDPQTANAILRVLMGSAGE